MQWRRPGVIRFCLRWLYCNFETGMWKPGEVCALASQLCRCTISRLFVLTSRLCPQEHGIFVSEGQRFRRTGTFLFTMLPSEEPRCPDSSQTKTEQLLLPSRPAFAPQCGADPKHVAMGPYHAGYCVSSSSLCPLEHFLAQGNGYLLAAVKTLAVLQISQTWQLTGASGGLMRQYSNATAFLNAAFEHG